MLNKVENGFWKDATYFDVGWLWLGCSLNSLLVFTFKKFFPSHLPHSIQDRMILNCFQLSRLWSSSSNLLLNYHIEKIGNLIQKFDVFFFVVVYFLLCNDQLCLRRFASVSSMKVPKTIISTCKKKILQLETTSYNFFWQQHVLLDSILHFYAQK